MTRFETCATLQGRAHDHARFGCDEVGPATTVDSRKGLWMTSTTTPPAVPTPEEQAMIEQARHEAQERVAELHVEEGTVHSEKARNSPHADDHD